MMNDNSLLIGYNLDKWLAYGLKEPIEIDVSVSTNSQILCAGMSGSGKSYATLWHLSNLYKIFGTEARFYFADFKQEDIFAFIRNCNRYYPYDKTVQALDEVYEIMHRRQSGDDKSRYPVILFWDEYAANILSMLQQNKKQAERIMWKVSEILMLGRSLSIRLYISVQRADAAVFPMGSRMNYGAIILLGAPIKSLYEMFLHKEYIDLIGNRQFEKGEGVALLQGNKLQFIKIPTARDFNKICDNCIKALNG